MIRVKFDPTAVDPLHQQFWVDWLQRAENATAKVVDAFETWLAAGGVTSFAFKFDSEVWKDLKDWLLENVYFNKCAYCEREISGYYGDAEHYRPKGAVKRKQANQKFAEPECALVNPATGKKITVAHPGYFWLAYDWRNLLPSCVYCNSGLGKNERFDVNAETVFLVKLSNDELQAVPAATRPRASKRWPGYYYVSPGQLDEAEAPLLLNPLNAPDTRDPKNHLIFGIKGIVAAIEDSPIGQNSIEVFRLEDEKLRQARQKAQETFGDRFFDAMRRPGAKPFQFPEADKVLEDYQAGKHPFSAAALDYYVEFLQHMPKAKWR